MNESDREPEPPVVRRLAGATVAAMAVAVAAVLLSGFAYVKLTFGWHPIPSTALGCSIHKRFHSSNGSPVAISKDLLPVEDCLKVTMSGRDEIIRDDQKTAAVRAWLDSRSDLWAENFLQASTPGKPLIEIRSCNQTPGTTDTYVYLDEDWIGFAPSKRYQRPICRGEWREMAAILAEPTPNR